MKLTLHSWVHVTAARRDIKNENPDIDAVFNPPKRQAALVQGPGRCTPVQATDPGPLVRRLCMCRR